MDQYADNLVRLRREAWDRQKVTLDRIAAENREPTAEERASLAEQDEAMSRMKADETAHIARAQLAVGLSEWRERVAPQVTASGRGEPSDRDFIRALVAGQLPDELKSSRDGWQRTDGFIAHNSDAYSFVVHTYQERALAIAAGTTVPQSFADFVVVYERTLNPTYNLATVIRSPDGAPLTIPRLTTDVNTGGTLTAEAGGVWRRTRPSPR